MPGLENQDSILDLNTNYFKRNFIFDHLPGETGILYFSFELNFLRLGLILNKFLSIYQIIHKL
jgi:hypothetical protein